MNILHFLIFFVGGALVVLFTINIELLNKFGKYFGVARGADIFVYIGVITLFYFYFDILNKHTKDKIELTKLISSLAIKEGYEKNINKISHRKNNGLLDKYIIHIRVWNEEHTVGEVIDEVIKAGFNKILLINDGSIDHSQHIIENKIKQYPNKLIILLNHSINRGGGAANQTGFNFIKRYHSQLKIDRGITFDADGQMDIQDALSAIHNYKNQNLDLIVGSRFIDGADVKNIPKSRKIILLISKIITYIFYGIHLSDPHNGFRIISTKAFQKFNITANGMHYANELNEQIKTHKMKFVEMPTHIKYTDYSLAKGQKNSNSIRLGLEMIYKKLFFR